MSEIKIPTVININDYPKELPPNTLRCDRKGKWGNPWVLGNIDTKARRLKVVESHKKELLTGMTFGIIWRNEIKELLDFDFLACWCSPKLCHCNNYIGYLVEVFEKVA